MYKLIMTKAFEDDLDETLEYISKRLYNSDAAQRLLNIVDDKISLIEEDPLLYPLYHDDKLAKQNYRFAVVNRYLLFYKVGEIEKIIYLSRFLYSSQNITDIFK